MKNHRFPIIFVLLAAFVLSTGFSVQAVAEFLEIPIQGTIDGGLAAFVERGIQTAESGNMDGIIFHVNTPGGRIDSAVEIKDAILDAKVLTIAFVDKSAISAGALITLACDSIYMTTGSSIGAATAVDLEGNKASEKVISYMRAQMRATAEANGRRGDIAEAMVDEQIEVPGINTKGQLITLTYTEALTYGISDGTIDSVAGVLEAVGKPGAPVIEFHLNWAEQIVRFLTDPIVSSILLSIGLLGLIIELRTPGWGVGGTVAVIALALFFGSHYIVRLAGIEEFLLLAAGLVLLALEIFVIPGFGVAGVAGIVLIVVSLFLSLIGSFPSRDAIISAGYTLVWSFVLAIILGLFIMRMVPRSPMFRKLTLEEAEHARNGYVSSDLYTDLVGKTGHAISTLRPVGKAEIDGRRMDVVTQGEYIPEGAPVVVIQVEGSRIVVKEHRA